MANWGGSDSLLATIGDSIISENWEKQKKKNKTKEENLYKESIRESFEVQVKMKYESLKKQGKTFSRIYLPRDIKFILNYDPKYYDLRKKVLDDFFDNMDKQPIN